MPVFFFTPPIDPFAHRGHGSELAALLHRGEHVAGARRQLLGFVRDLVDEAARAGEVPGDVSPDELAADCLHALEGAGALHDDGAVTRLVGVTLAGLRATG